MRKLWIVAVLAAGVTAVLVSPASAAAKTHNLAGTITLEGQTSDALAHDLAVGGVCTGIGDFTDVHQGASVTIRNGSGRIIKVAPLGGGRASRPGDPYSGCVFAFNVKVSDTCCYVIKTPDGEEITYSKSALSRDKWQVTLGLGTTRD